MMQATTKSSLLYCHSGMIALVGPRCTLHAFPRLHSYSPITSAPEEDIKRMFPTEAAVDKKTASYEIGFFPSELEEKTQLHQRNIFYGRPAAYSEIHIDLDLQRHGIQHVTWADADKSMYFV